MSTKTNTSRVYRLLGTSRQELNCHVGEMGIFKDMLAVGSTVFWGMPEGGDINIIRIGKVRNIQDIGEDKYLIATDEDNTYLFKKTQLVLMGD